MNDNTLVTFRLMNLKTLDTHAKDFLYILNFKKLSETLLQVYRLNMTKYATCEFLLSCILSIGKKRYIKEISLTFAVMKYWKNL